MFQKLQGNFQEDYGKCSRRFWGIFKKIPVIVQEDFRECLKRVWGMLCHTLGLIWYKIMGEKKAITK